MNEYDVELKIDVKEDLKINDIVLKSMERIGFYSNVPSDIGLSMQVRGDNVTVSLSFKDRSDYPKKRDMIENLKQELAKELLGKVVDIDPLFNEVKILGVITAVLVSGNDVKLFLAFKNREDCVTESDKIENRKHFKLQVEEIFPGKVVDIVLVFGREGIPDKVDMNENDFVLVFLRSVRVPYVDFSVMIPYVNSSIVLGYVNLMLKFKDESDYAKKGDIIENIKRQVTESFQSFQSFPGKVIRIQTSILQCTG